MDYEIIAEQLIKKGFLKNNYGSPEKVIGNFNIAFVEHPFYHIIMYSRKNEDNRMLFAPSEIKLPKTCNIDDVLFAIDNLIQGVSESKIVLDIFTRLNSDKTIDKKGAISKSRAHKSINKIEFKIEQNIGILSESSKEWKKELNLISWNDKGPKYDLRVWDSVHKKMGKGVTLTAEELSKLRDILNSIKIEPYQNTNNINTKKDVILADILYTSTDETFYVLNGPSKYVYTYKANSMDKMFKMLEKDGWTKCGMINRFDGSSVDMLRRNNEYIAIWEE